MHQTEIMAEAVSSTQGRDTRDAHHKNQPPRGLRATLRALRHRNFQLFFSGQLISLIGTWMQNIAQDWLVYRLTGSSLLLGVVGFAGQIPVFLLARAAGMVGDGFNLHPTDSALLVTRIF